jgi:hypothetical protein
MLPTADHTRLKIRGYRLRTDRRMARDAKHVPAEALNQIMARLGLHVDSRAANKIPAIYKFRRSHPAFPFYPMHRM